MTANLTATTSSTSITNNHPPAPSRCGLNQTGICCKESETAHVVRVIGADRGVVPSLADSITNDRGISWFRVASRADEVACPTQIW
jgi:hypothetical protein